jgi:RND family efflux transporter MFP subunit
MKKTVRLLILAGAIGAVVVVGMRVMATRKAQQATALSAPTTNDVLEFAASDKVEVKPKALQLGLPISGSLRAVRSALIKARVAGELMDLQVREGDAVKAGQVLARIDPTEYQRRLRQAQEQAEAAKAQVDIAQRQFDNNRALVDQGFISKTALDTSLATLQSAQATYRAAVAGAEVSRKALEDSQMVAPFSGWVAARAAQNGERLAIDARILELVDLSQLEVEATLSAADSVKVRIGQTAHLSVEGQGQTVAARVQRINPSAQTGSRSVLVYLQISDVTGLRQGLFTEGVLGTEQRTVLAVPVNTVRTDQPAPYVQVIEDQKVRHVPVQLGARGTASGDPQSENWVEVQGLREGSQVLGAHVGRLREGTPVKITQAPKAAGG